MSALGNSYLIRFMDVPFMMKDGFSESMHLSGAKCNGVEEFSRHMPKKIDARGVDPGAQFRSGMVY